MSENEPHWVIEKIPFIVGSLIQAVIMLVVGSWLLSGVVEQVEDNTVQITRNTEELAEVADDGKISDSNRRAIRRTEDDVREIKLRQDTVMQSVARFDERFDNIRERLTEMNRKLDRVAGLLGGKGGQ